MHDFDAGGEYLAIDPGSLGRLVVLGMSVFNPLRHPQTLFAGFKEDDPRLHHMQALVGESRLLKGRFALSSLRQEDWDLLVVEGSPVEDGEDREPPWASSIDDRIFVLAFGGPTFGMSVSGLRLGASSLVRASGKQYGRTLRVAEGLEGRLSRLVRDECFPAVNTMDPIPYLMTSDSPLESYASTFATPLLLDADGHHVASIFKRTHDGESVCWALPHRSEQPELWLAAALEQWSTVYPERFPAASPWRQRPSWMTSEEADVTESLQSLEEAREEQETHYREERRRLEVDAEVARANADSGVRRLLTEQSDALVAAVRSALEQLGFVVEDVDEERGREGLAKVEDLRVTSQEHPGIDVIAEVKGLGGGARPTDIQQLGRHAMKFALRHRKAPDRQWYVVNQFRSDDPDARERPLVSQPEAVELFAQDGGLIIDTRSLFSLLRDVEGGDLTGQQAQKKLMSSTGVFDHGLGGSLSGS